MTMPDLLEEFVKAPAGYQLPYSWLEKMQLRLARSLASMPVFAGLRVSHTYQVPPAWHVLLMYLYRMGVVRQPQFQMIPMQNNLPGVAQVKLSSVHTAAVTDGSDRSEYLQGFGISFDQEEARAKALGELLERYTLSTYKHDQLHMASFSHMPHGSLNPTNVGGYLQWQQERFPYLTYTPESPISWVQGTELLSGAHAYIPAQLVFWNYRFEPDEPVLAYPSTNGGAGAFTFKDAVVRAAYEAIERDAFFVYWLNTISPPRLVFAIAELKNHKVRRLLQQLDGYALTPYFLDTTTDLGVPTVTCVLVDDRGDEPRLAVGGSAGFDMEQNIYASALEALSILNVYATAPQPNIQDPYLPFLQENIDREFRLALWRGRGMLERMQFFLSGDEKQLPYFDVPQSFAHLISTLRSKGPGYELYVYEARHPVLDALGYHVVRVNIPKLFPLYLYEHLVTLNAQRLHDFPQLLGRRAVRNPWPHPYP